MRGVHPWTRHHRADGLSRGDEKEAWFAIELQLFAVELIEHSEKQQETKANKKKKSVKQDQ